MKQTFILAVLTWSLFSGACTGPEKSINDELANSQKVVKVVNSNSTLYINTGYNIGDIATDFSLLNIDGKKISLSDYPEAKGFIITFTCNHCPYSVAYEDRIIALDLKYKSKGYPVIAINPNNPNYYPIDSYENMKIRANNKKFTFPYLLDDGQKIYPQYGATKTPHVFVLQKTNKGNKVEYIGAIDDNISDASAVNNRFVELVVDALLNGEEPPIRKTKAIGCSIKT